MNDSNYSKFILLFLQLVIAFILISKGGTKIYEVLNNKPKTTLENLFMMNEMSGSFKHFLSNINSEEIIVIEEVEYDSLMLSPDQLYRIKEEITPEFYASDETISDLKQKVRKQRNKVTVNFLEKLWMIIKALFLTSIVGLILWNLGLYYYKNKNNMFMVFVVFKFIFILIFLLVGFSAALESLGPDFLDFGKITEIKFKNYMYVSYIPVFVILILLLVDIVRCNVGSIKKANAGATGGGESDNVGDDAGDDAA